MSQRFTGVLFISLLITTLLSFLANYNCDKYTRSSYKQLFTHTTDDPVALESNPKAFGIERGLSFLNIRSTYIAMFSLVCLATMIALMDVFFRKGALKFIAENRVPGVLAGLCILSLLVVIYILEVSLPNTTIEDMNIFESYNQGIVGLLMLIPIYSASELHELFQKEPEHDVATD